MLMVPAVISSRPAIHAEGRALAASGGADEDDKLPIANLEIDAVNGFDAARIYLGHLVEPLPGPWIVMLSGRSNCNRGRHGVSAMKELRAKCGVHSDEWRMQGKSLSHKKARSDGAHRKQGQKIGGGSRVDMSSFHGK